MILKNAGNQEWMATRHVKSTGGIYQVEKVVTNKPDNAKLELTSDKLKKSTLSRPSQVGYHDSPNFT